MAHTWLQIQVELAGGRGMECDPAPGRVFIVGPSHSFSQLAEAINLAFARWDPSHLHIFELPDGRTVGFADDEDEDRCLDHDALKVAQELSPGDLFTYTFDFGDDWLHRCEVRAEKVDPREYGPEPLARSPVPIDGWGWIPDQYDRASRDY
jgi:pRiA4b ORF-3-like protein